MLEIVDRLESINPAIGKTERGNYFDTVGDIDKAIDCFRKAIELDSTYWEAWNHLIGRLRRVDRYSEAVKWAKEFVNWHHGSLPYIELAKVYRDMGALDLAEKTCATALKLFPEQYSFYELLSEIKFLLGDLAEAERYLKPLLLPDMPISRRKECYYLMSRIYLYQGRITEWAKMMDKQIDLNWQSSDTSAFAISTVYMAREHYRLWRDKRHALAAVQKITFEVNTDLYQTGLAEVYIYIGEFQKAAKAAEKVNHSIMRMGLEILSFKAKGEWDKALELSERLIEELPNSKTQLGYIRALCYIEKVEFDSAIKEINEAMSIRGFNYEYVFPQSFLLLGKIYEKKGDTKFAIENYEKFLDLWKNADKDLPDLIDAKKRLAKLKEISNKGS